MRRHEPLTTGTLGTRLAVLPARLAILLLLALALWSGAAGAQVTDDFSSTTNGVPTIDQTKWQDFDLNLVRRITGGQLELSVNRLGAIRTSALSFTNPATVMSMRATVTVTEASVVGTAGFPRARARVFGGFYNDGTPGPGLVGDVNARIELRSDALAPPGMVRVLLVVDVCASADCNTVAPNSLFDSTAFGPVPIGSPHTLELAWDGATTFTFTVDQQAPFVYKVGGVDAGPPKDLFRNLSVNAGSSPTTPADGGSIRALFDNVFNNGTLYETFDSTLVAGSLDPTKWLNPQEFVKRNTGGVFESALARFGSAGSNSLLVLQPELATTLAADLTVTATRNSSARPQARVLGQFFNDGSSPAGSQLGDVGAVVSIFDHENGSGLQGGAAVFRCLDATCAATEILFNDETTFGAVALGSIHRLSIGFDGTTFSFGFDAQRVSFTPNPQTTPNAGPARNNVRLIGTRIGNPPAAPISGTQGGFVSAIFDNFVGTPTPTATTTGSTGLGGAPANGPSQAPVISSDGRFVAFVSSASNLVASGCTTTVAQIFVIDQTTGVTTCISVAVDGSAGNAASSRPSISADGRLVAFLSAASNLGACPTGGPHVFVRDRVAGTTICVSVSTGGIPADAPSDAPAISASGAAVAFVAAATNLGACVGGGPHVFLRILATNTTICVSVAPDGVTAGTGPSGAPVLNADATVVVFQSAAGNLVAAGCLTAVVQIYRRVLPGGPTTCMSVDSANPANAGNGNSAGPAVSADGNTIAFASVATNLVTAGCTTGLSQIFVRIVTTGTTTCISVGFDGAPGDGPSFDAALSGDGRVIAFATNATTLPLVGSGGGAASATAPARALPISNLAQIIRGSTAVQGAFERLSQAAGGAAGNGSSSRPSLSFTGTAAVFESAASNLTAADTNNQPDVFVVVPTTTRVAITAPLSGTQFGLNLSPTLTIAWTTLTAATDYLFEYTAANGAFSNPNGTTLDPANAGGGSFPVAATSVSVTLGPGFPPGTYQVRVIGRAATGQLLGSFSDAVSLVLLSSIPIAANARPSLLAPGTGVTVPAGSSVTFLWSAIPGVGSYGVEFTGPGTQFTNPNAAGPDPVNGFGTPRGGAFVVQGNGLTVVLPPGLTGTFQLRVIGLAPTGGVAGTFSDAITLVIQ